ncbi:MAG: ATP-binding protein [Endomicrobiales bacterium]
MKDEPPRNLLSMSHPGFHKKVEGTQMNESVSELSGADPKTPVPSTPGAQGAPGMNTPVLQNSFRTLAQYSPHLIAIFDRGLRCVFANRAWCNALACPPEHFTSKTLPELVPPGRPGARLVRRFREVFASRKTTSFESEILLRNEKRLCHMTLVSEPGADGEAEAVISVCRDLTEQRRTEDVLRKSEERLQLAISATNDAIWDWNILDDVVSWNDSYSTRYGRPPEGADSTQWWVEHIHPGDRDRVSASLRDAVRGSAVKWEEEYRFLKTDGGWAHVCDRACIARGRDGKAYRAVGALMDLTGRKRAEEVLRRDKATLEKLVEAKSGELLKARLEVERSKRLSDIGVLASSIAHEMRNPLAAIKTAAFNIRRKAGDPAIESHLAHIEKKVNESDLIIQNLLSFARMKEPQFEQVALAPLLNVCLDAVLPRYAKWAVEFEKRLSFGEGDSIAADPTHMKILFSNLLDNAVQALVDKKGRVSLEGRFDRDHVRIEVRDTGGGIDRQDLARVFEPFFTRKSRGTGLGLTICKQIVEFHRGKITVASTKGAGTSVKILLPLAPEGFAPGPAR